MKAFALATVVGAVCIVSAAPAGAQFSDEKIRIGILSDLAGIYSDINGEGAAVAARLAAEDMGNAVGGKPVEIIVAGHQNKPDVAASIARKWVDTEQVDVIADVPNSAAALAVQAITKERKRIFLMSGPGSVELTGKSCSPYGFMWTWDTHSVSAGHGASAHRQRRSKLVFRHGRLCIRTFAGR